MRGFLVVALVALVACRSSTQIDVEVSTNVPCSSWQGAAVAVGELGPELETKPATTTTTHCDATGHLGTVVAIPSGAENANVAFRVVGAVTRSLESCTQDAGDGCIVARRALNFIPHETLSLSVPLVSSCEGILCDPTSTCVAGTCRPATIPDPGQCASQTCGEGALPLGDGGAPDATVGDGGRADGESDATLSDGGNVDASVDGNAPPPFEAGTFDAAFAGCGTSCALSVGQDFACVVLDGGVACWGQDFSGETGNDLAAPSIAAPAPVRAADGGYLSGVRGIVSGWDTSCAYLLDGGISCWGGGSPLESSDDLVATPQAQFAGSPQLAIGNYHLCAVTPGRQIVCQAATANGTEPVAFDNDGGSAPVTLPPPAGYLPPFPVLATTPYFTCVLTPDGAVYCLGDNQYGSESNPGGDNSNVTAFTQVQVGAPAQDLVLMAYAACVRTAGHVLCWGDNSALETGSSAGGITEVLFADGGSLGNAVQLAGGFYHGCARLSDGHIACWGSNQGYQLGRGGPVGTDGGITGAAALVVDADGGPFGSAAYVAAGEFDTCALKTDGSLWCWGDNSSGQLGQDAGDTATRTVPTRVTP